MLIFYFIMAVLYQVGRVGDEFYYLCTIIAIRQQLFERNQYAPEVVVGIAAHRRNVAEHLFPVARFPDCQSTVYLVYQRVGRVRPQSVVAIGTLGVCGQMLFVAGTDKEFAVKDFFDVHADAYAGKLGGIVKVSLSHTIHLEPGNVKAAVFITVKPV